MNKTQNREHVFTIPRRDFEWMEYLGMVLY